MVLSKEEAYTIIKKLLEEKKLSIFAGSGISVDSGLPTWDGLVDRYIGYCKILNSTLDPIYQFTDVINDAEKNKGKDLIETITALKQKVSECEHAGINTDFLDSNLNETFSGKRPNEYHKAIVSTDYNHIITTNYDELLEKAAMNLGYNNLITRSYSYNDSQNISGAVYSGKTAIIHAHGKISKIKMNDLVITKKDYISIMKYNPGFRMSINALFITNSVLFVGYGGSDPHFEDIIDDLNFTLKWDQSRSDLPKCYIMLKADKITPIREYLSKYNRIDIISFNMFDEMKEFLDQLASECPRTK